GLMKSRAFSAVALGCLGLACAAPAPKPAVTPALAAVAPAAAPPPAATGATPPAPRITPDAPFREQAPGAGPEQPYHPPHWTRFKLKNGLEVFLVEFHDLPLVDFNLVVKTGSAANPPDKAGLADLTARMLVEGTKTRGALEIADQVAALGATLVSGSTWEASSTGLSTLTKNLDAALGVFADVVQNPAFDAKEFARVRDNLLTAIARRKDSPPTVAGLALAHLLYGAKHPYGWPTTGTEATLKKVTPADLRAFWEANYHPNNAALIVAGDVSEADLRGKLETAFKGWRAKHVAARKLPPATPLAQTKVFLIDKAGAPQSSIRVGQIGIDRLNPDYFAVTVMNLILGGGFYRLDLNLREGKGWTYGARSSFESRRAPGPFSAGGEFVAPHSADSVAEILKEVNGIRDSDVSDAELARAKDQIVKSFPARFATRASAAAQLADLAVFGFPDSYWAEYPKKVMAVTKDDVRRVARKYLDPAHLAIVVVGDRQSIEGPLAKIAPVETRDLDGEPVSAGEGSGASPATTGSAAGVVKKTASSEGHPSHDERRGH
ncbi:MAG TPA: pitrilysin family protein, partial [Polyangia bacterium]|nr:pitrilysin family protein [Polyangia bacterium]